MIFHVIDIGSNSVRLMKVEGGLVLYKTLITTRLGKSLQRSGKIEKEEFNDSLNAVLTFVNRARNEKSDGIFAFGTAALREAKNASVFVAEAYEKSGVEIEVLSGEKESEIGFIGAKKDGFERLAVIDIGGASSEICGGKDTIEFKRSYKIGAVTLFSESNKNLEVMKKTALKKLDGLLPISRLFSQKDGERDVEIIGIGGTITSIAAILLELEKYDKDKVDGYKIAKQKVEEFIEQAKEMPTDVLCKKHAIDFKRAEIIVEGAVILDAFMTKLQVDFITASESDNLEGYAKIKGIIA